MDDNHEFQPMPQNPNWCARFGCMKDREHHMTTTNPLAALTPAALAAIRAVVLEVIDGRRFYLYENEVLPDNAVVTEAGANDERLDFCEAIQRKIWERAAPAAATVRGGTR